MAVDSRLDGSTPIRAAIGVVAIGRNEGPRLAECLESIAGIDHLVYVDSGSTDGSDRVALDLGADVVRLTSGPPFTAAWARDAGVDRLAQRAPGLDYVMFIDGDCTLDPGWLGRAVAALDADPGLAVVCGRRREREPGRSVFRRLLDIEWDVPPGRSVDDCGGDAAFRISAYRDAGGYARDLPVGEEPELCHRLRDRGWRIDRIDAEMTSHDMGEASIGPWWRRHARQGYAALDIARRFPGPSGPYRRRVRSAWVWGVAVPAGILAASAVGPRLIDASPIACGLAAAMVYPLQVARMARQVRHRVDGLGLRLAYGLAIVAASWAHLAGQATYLADRLAGRAPRLLEYRASREAPAAE
ncbi:glycosyltransferase [Tundrisphaera sp. TA3]|uniref:glycosyltransferase n=1 Tax=Tundrisphaera sp. TA3 TaxID=3435775 RepID=UPI003EBCB67B